jgi:7-carboxy-7-deazaguanine synthase
MANALTMLPVMETFYSVQGEGFHVGTPAYFIRLGGCDVGCSWCDVKDSWDHTVHPIVSVAELVERVVKSGSRIAVITGGEPAMYDLSELTNALRKMGIRTHLETSGVHPISGTWDWITFSPKKFKVPHPSVFALADELKVIVFHRSDLEWAIQFVAQIRVNTALFLQPEWDRREQNTPLILDFIQRNPEWRISLQTHKYLGVD